MTDSTDLAYVEIGGVRCITLKKLEGSAKLQKKHKNEIGNLYQEIPILDYKGDQKVDNICDIVVYSKRMEMFSKIFSSEYKNKYQEFQTTIPGGYQLQYKQRAATVWSINFYTDKFMVQFGTNTSTSKLVNEWCKTWSRIIEQINIVGLSACIGEKIGQQDEISLAKSNHGSNMNKEHQSIISENSDNGLVKEEGMTSEDQNEEIKEKNEGETTKTNDENIVQSVKVTDEVSHGKEEEKISSDVTENINKMTENHNQILLKMEHIIVSNKKAMEFRESSEKEILSAIKGLEHSVIHKVEEKNGEIQSNQRAQIAD